MLCAFNDFMLRACVRVSDSLAFSSAGNLFERFNDFMLGACVFRVSSL